MQVLRGAAARSAWPRGSVLTIGNYDGIHRGQRRVIDKVVERARARGVPAVLLTFDPHPLQVLDPTRAPQRLTTDAQRESQLAAAGVDAVVVLPFTPEVAAMEAEAFVREVLVESLGVSEVFVGSGFAFGRGRRGTLALLRELGARHGFTAQGLDELVEGGEPVSATRIRRAVAAGDVELAAQLLGRPYAIAGTVVAGDQVGRQLGWPTANLATPDALLPGYGVYAATLDIVTSGRTEQGVANVGVRPTRGGDAAAHVEIHLFDFSAELYGAAVEIAFLRKLRAEQRFESLEALAEQIARDAENAREYFSRRRRSERGAGATLERAGAAELRRAGLDERDRFHGE